MFSGNFGDHRRGVGVTARILNGNISDSIVIVRRWKQITLLYSIRVPGVLLQYTQVSRRRVLVQKSYAKFCTKFICFSLDISNLYVRVCIKVYVVQPFNLQLFLVVSYGSRQNYSPPLAPPHSESLTTLALRPLHVKYFGDVLWSALQPPFRQIIIHLS